MKNCLLILVVILFSFSVLYALSGNPHAFLNDDCSKCHVDYATKPSELTASVVSLCMRCHDKTAMITSHPMDITPCQTRIPKDFPLTYGKITCSTCHNIHNKRFNEEGEKTYFLRQNLRGKAFCAACHEASLIEGIHAEFVTRGITATQNVISNKDTSYDRMSKECLQCHNELAPANVRASSGTDTVSKSCVEHAVGVKYDALQKKKCGLRQRGMITEEIRFFKGRIGCGTCHNIYSKLPKKLVLKKGQLCKGCHDRDRSNCNGCHEK